MKRLIKVFVPLIAIVTMTSVQLNAGAVTPKKLALVIGNKDYKYATVLKNTLNDAQDVSAALKKVGFETMLYTNLDYAGFLKAISAFAEKAPDYDVLLFYYSGHGMMYSGGNYLVPIDASIKNKEQQIEVECININRITSNFNNGENKANIAIVDACRNKPFNREWLSDTRDIEQTNRFKLSSVSGTIVAQSAGDGETSSDNPKGRNGLYTASLLRYINQPGLSINEVFQLTRREVKSKSNNSQNPIEFNELIGNFYFIPPVGVDPSTVVVSNSNETNKDEPESAAPQQRKRSSPDNLSTNSIKDDGSGEIIHKTAVKGQPVRLQEGTGIRLILNEEINSRTATIGDPVELEVLEDVLVDGQIVIKAGSPVKGEIIESSKAKMFGKAGKIDFIANYALSVDGQNVRVRSTKKFEGKNRTAGMVVAAYFFLPAVFMKGKEAKIDKGTRFNGYIDNSYTITGIIER